MSDLIIELIRLNSNLGTIFRLLMESFGWLILILLITGMIVTTVLAVVIYKVRIHNEVLRKERVKAKTHTRSITYTNVGNNLPAGNSGSNI
jgi:hypothetical protein